MVLCQEGLHLLGKGVHFVVCLCTQKIEESVGDTVEQTIIERVVVGVEDGVLKRGLLWIVDGLLHLFLVPAYAFNESFFNIFQGDAVEGNGMMWGVVRNEEGVFSMVVVYV